MGQFGQDATGGLGFAVVDVETTGLYLSTDRVIEVGIVHLDANAEIIGQFCTLINPGRDVGPTSLHGIAAADVYDAPTFAHKSSCTSSANCRSSALGYPMRFRSRPPQGTGNRNSPA
jgi:hypothetical protein